MKRLQQKLGIVLMIYIRAEPERKGSRMFYNIEITFSGVAISPAVETGNLKDKKKVKIGSKMFDEWQTRVYEWLID
jgi:hypothetical protein